MKEICYKKRTIEQFKTTETIPRLECNEKWKPNGHKESTKNDQKQQITICALKQNIKLHDFNTSRIKNRNVEFKLYTIGII